MILDYKSTNDFHNIQNVFIETIYLRDSQKKVFSSWFKSKINIKSLFIL